MTSFVTIKQPFQMHIASKESNDVSKGNDLQKILSSIVANQAEGLKQMQALVTAVSQMTTTTNEPKPQVESKQVEADPQVQLPAVYGLFVGSSLRVGKCDNLMDLLENASFSECPSKLLQYKEIVEGKEFVYVPYICENKLQIISKERGQSHQSFIGSTVVENKVCIKMIQTIQAELKTKIALESIEDKLQYRQMLAFGLLNFMRFLEINKSNRLMHENLRFLFTLLVHIEKALIFESSLNEYVPPLFSKEDELSNGKKCYRLGHICSNMLQKMLTETQMNRWVWSIICAFSFPLIDKSNVVWPAFDLRPCNTWFKDIEVIQTLDMVTEIKNCSQSTAKCIELCMDVILLYAEDHEPVAELLWNRLLDLHNRMESVQKLKPVFSYLDVNVYKTMFQFLGKTQWVREEREER